MGKTAQEWFWDINEVAGVAGDPDHIIPKIQQAMAQAWEEGRETAMEIADTWHDASTRIRSLPNPYKEIK